jgi:hypothetical protein
VTPAHLGFDEYDVAAQGLVSHHYWVPAGKAQSRSVDSTSHVSVWEKDS